MTAAATLIFLGAEISANAQTTTQTQDFSAFKSVDISSGFSVKFEKSDNYSATWTVNKDLNELVQVYVKGGTLYASFLKKGMSPELKKTYKGKNGPAIVLNITVSAPSLSEVNFGDDVTADCSGLPADQDYFTLKTTSNSVVSNLDVESDEFVADMDKKSVATVNCTARSLQLKTGNSSELNISVPDSSETVQFDLGGSSTVNFTGNTEKAVMNMSGSSTLNIKGEANSIEVNSLGSSEINANDFPVYEAYVTMQNSSKLYVNASETLQVDLKGNSHVVFQNDPEVKIVEILSSSLTRWENENKR